MKKFLIYSLFTVALIVFGAIIFLKIKSEPKPTIVSENGDELAKAMQTTLDVSAWDSLHFLHWSFRGDTEYTWDKVQNLVVVKWDGNQVNLTLDKVEGIAFSDGIQAGKWKPNGWSERRGKSGAMILTGCLPRSKFLIREQDVQLLNSQTEHKASG
ncbi:MAG: hypothetical protein IPN72_06955 [Saprospiraceae bacterium]|nr:hypothetical protein [Saprospiraceae bacterium]